MRVQNLTITLFDLEQIYDFSLTDIAIFDSDEDELSFTDFEVI